MKRNLTGIFIGFGIFLALAGVLVWVGFIGLGNHGELEKELARKERELKKYQTQTEKQTPPTPEAYTLLEKVNQKLQMDLVGLEKLMGATLFKIPPGTATDGLFFREQLFTIDKDLHLLATGKEASIPDTLGFPEELPDTSRVPLLLRQLGTIDKAARIFIEEGAASLSVVKPLEILEHKDTPSNRILFRELPVQIGVECSTQTLIRSLIRLRNSDQMLLLRELQVKSKDDQTIQVNLIISSFSLQESHAES